MRLHAIVDEYVPVPVLTNHTSNKREKMELAGEIHIACP
jgi:hypothetical protein